jgi:hypothetical protein
MGADEIACHVAKEGRACDTLDRRENVGQRIDQADGDIVAINVEALDRRLPRGPVTVGGLERDGSRIAARKPPASRSCVSGADGMTVSPVALAHHE